VKEGAGVEREVKEGARVEREVKEVKEGAGGPRGAGDG
jgi:hypothetical protein